MKPTTSPLLLLLLLLLSLYLLAFPISCNDNQITSLRKLIKSRKSAKAPRSDAWVEMDTTYGRLSSVYVGNQDGLMETDKIDTLPGQPTGVDLNQYAGYVTVDPKNGRALFYYFVESPQDSSTKPLVLWLNGDDLEPRVTLILMEGNMNSLFASEQPLIYILQVDEIKWLVIV
ncbi:unnamed protein product [Dovyalis caffra]|uniref:Uncharacterized protein n=1 Tax=Dovyalis caffra TaxID=77055 RepID=A0AAV1SBH3_9ROSI|nr:unnamed protein product [Dovyalis caffra]